MGNLHMLTLELQLPRTQVPQGGEILMRVRLANPGDAAVEVASLFDNNQITNYAVLDANGNLIKIVNHVTRQLLTGRGEPRTGDFRLITLTAGGEEIREDNLCRYEWFDRPGFYFVRALYRWQGNEIWSAPQPLEIVPAPLHAYDQQWVYHYGERFQLQSTWVAELPDGRLELYLRESLRSRPTVINHNRSLGSLAKPIQPKLSFDRSLMAGGSVWLAWLGEGTVTVLKTAGGKPVGEPQEHVLGLRELDWIGPPIASSDDDLVMFCSAARPDGGRLVTALRIGPDGSERQREVAIEQLTGAVITHGFCDEGGVFHLVWLSGETQELWHQPISLSTLQCLGTRTRLWRVPGVPLAILTPPVWTSESYLACLHLAVEPAASPMLGLAWLQLDERLNPRKTERLAVPSLENLAKCTGETTDSGRLFALLTTRESLIYVDGALAQWRQVALAKDFYPEGLELITVNGKNDVFLVGNRVGMGLSETFLQGGLDEDMSEEASP
jgi:hypothetical protein